MELLSTKTYFASVDKPLFTLIVNKTILFFLLNKPKISKVFVNNFIYTTINNSKKEIIMFQSNMRFDGTSLFSFVRTKWAFLLRIFAAFKFNMLI